MSRCQHNIIYKTPETYLKKKILNIGEMIEEYRRVEEIIICFFNGFFYANIICFLQLCVYGILLN